MLPAFLLFFLGAAPAGAAQPNPASLVNVTDPRFAQGCPGAADPLGRGDSTCAIRAAVRWAESTGIPGGGFPILYFPHGVYHVAGSGYHSAITITKRISIQGDGAASTALVDTSAHGALLTYLQADGCSGMPGACPITVQGISFAGQGSSTAGGLVEIDSTNTGSMRNVAFSDTGGIALNLQGSSERWFFEDMETLNTRWPVLLEGDTNETYFNRVNVLNGGEAGSYCYSVNCPGGKRINSGLWLPDPHSAVYLDGDNVHWSNSSIKSTEAIGGIRLAPVTSSVSHTYIEGFPWGGQPRLNHAVAAPGKLELGHLTAAIGPGALDIPVDDAEWQPLYVNDPEQARINGTHSYVNAYGIFPADYLKGSSEPSRAAPGVTRGTVEFVQVAAFSGDGHAHLFHRGAKPTSWPAGSVIEQVAPNGYGVQRIEEDHLNSLASQHDPRYQSGCSDTAQRAAGWISSPSRLCAEIIAGLVPDGFMVPFPPIDYVHQSFSVALVDNSIFTGGAEAGGQGWLKVPGNANVELDGVNEPLRSFVDAETALHTYVNGANRVQIVEWPGAHGGRTVSALAYVADPSAGVRFSPQEGFYAADVMHDRSLSQQTVGPRCWYNTPAGSAAPTSHACADGMASAARSGSAGGAAPVKYVVRDWQVNRLAARGEAGDCAARDTPTGAVHFSTAADAALLVNLSPNPQAAVQAWGTVTGDGSTVALRLCNSTAQPVVWKDAPTVTLTQLP